MEDIAGVKLKRNYNLNAPKGVNGRNSDNTKIKQYLGWEPSIRLKEGFGQDLRVDRERNDGGIQSVIKVTVNGYLQFDGVALIVI